MGSAGTTLLSIIEIEVCRRPPTSVTNLCRGPPVTNRCRGPLWTVLQSSNRRVAGRVCPKTPDSVTSFVAKRPPGPIYKPDALGCCHVHTYIYTHMYLCVCIHVYTYIQHYTMYSEILQGKTDTTHDCKIYNTTW